MDVIDSDPEAIVDDPESPRSPHRSHAMLLKADPPSAHPSLHHSDHSDAVLDVTPEVSSTPPATEESSQPPLMGPDESSVTPEHPETEESIGASTDNQFEGTATPESSDDRVLAPADDKNVNNKIGVTMVPMPAVPAVAAAASGPAPASTLPKNAIHTRTVQDILREKRGTSSNNSSVQSALSNKSPASNLSNNTEGRGEYNKVEMAHESVSPTGAYQGGDRLELPGFDPSPRSLQEQPSGPQEFTISPFAGGRKDAELHRLG